MDAIQKNNEITKLKNQLIINDAWNSWEDKKRQEFEKKNMTSSMEITDLEIQVEDLEKEAMKPKMSSTLFSVLYLLCMAFIYAIPVYFKSLVDYMMYGFYASFGALVFVFFRRGNRKSNTALASLFCCLASSMSFLFVCYVAAIVADGVDFASGINAVNIMEFEIFGIIRPYYLICSLVFAFILALVSMIKKTRHDNRIYRAKRELNNIKNKLDVDKKRAIEENDAFEKEVLDKKVEYFTRHPLALPELSNSQVKDLIRVLNTTQAQTIEEALILYKAE